MTGYTEVEERNLRVVRQFFGEEPGAATPSGTSSRARTKDRGLLPGRDSYKLETCRASDVVSLPA